MLSIFWANYSVVMTCVWDMIRYFDQTILVICQVCVYVIMSTVTSRLFTHIVSTEKLRKEIRDRKDPRGIKHTYYNGSFFLYCF